MRTTNVRMTVDERIYTATKFIEQVGVTDEDLKQELYATALEFNKCADGCDKFKQHECLRRKLIEVHDRYVMDNAVNMYVEVRTVPYLRGFDEIVHIRLGY